MDVSRETADRLRVLSSEVERWNAAINLVASSTLGDIWRRHVLDSLQLVQLATSGVRRWVDLGSGGGFPGLVVAAALAEQPPAMSMILIECDRRKAVFLRQTAAAMNVAVQVETARAEAVPPLAADVVSARALAPLTELLALVRRHIAADGVALLHKGADYKRELAEARQRFAFSVVPHPSVTREDAVVLEVRDIRDA